jgi:hypothetical protein
MNSSEYFMSKLNLWITFFRRNNSLFYHLLSSYDIDNVESFLNGYEWVLLLKLSSVKDLLFNCKLILKILLYSVFLGIVYEVALSLMLLYEVSFEMLGQTSQFLLLIYYKYGLLTYWWRISLFLTFTLSILHCILLWILFQKITY